MNSDIPACVIIGLPASGKTKFGTSLADALGVEFKDVDREIEFKAGKTIPEIFNDNGEAYFRKLETEVFYNLITQKNIVISCGGGLPTQIDNQELINNYKNEGGVVVYLSVDQDEAVKRIHRRVEEGRNVRPMFENLDERQISEKWGLLFKARDDTYTKSATIKISNHLDYLELIKQLKSYIGAKHVYIYDQFSSEIKYEVAIGDNLYDAINYFLPNKTQKIAIFYTKSVEEHLQKTLLTAINTQKYQVLTYEVEDGEAVKTIDAYEDCLEWLVEQKLERSDAIVSFGGGAVTDFAGFVASTFLRGIKYINCPTTLLAMIDASTGGKTGINLKSGKNLCGAFYEPEVVLIDQTTLLTLKNREYLEGLAEAIKMGFVFDNSILNCFDNININTDENIATKFDQQIREEIIFRSVKKKAEIVSIDLKESGLRMLLNYGHTFGHIVEKFEHFKIRHGEGVAIGMIFAAKLAFNLDMIDQNLLDYHYQILEKFNLPTDWNIKNVEQFKNLNEGEIVGLIEDALLTDKKTKNGVLNFVLLGGFQMPQIVEVSDKKIIRDVILQTIVNV